MTKIRDTADVQTSATTTMRRVSANPPGRVHRWRGRVLVAVLLGASATSSPIALEKGHAAEQSRPPASPPPVTPVASVNLERYGGVWRELAKIPNRFQRQCARHTLAQYTLRDDGQLKVVNQCLTRNGILFQASGVARIVDPSSQARLKVSLVSFLGLRPFWGDYWVIGLDENYRWAVVGTPDRRYGWVLARSPLLDEASWSTIAAILTRNGYTLSSFVLDDPLPPPPGS